MKILTRKFSVGHLWMVLFSLTVVLALCEGVTSTAWATIFSVTSTTDAVDADPGDGVCNNGAGKCTLRAAIMEANALLGADTISLPAGIYTLTIVGNRENAAATGDLDITDDLTVIGAGADVTVLDANSLDGLIDIIGSTSVLGATLHIEGVTITGGNAIAGGGIHNFGTLTITNSTLTGNDASANGGGIVTAGFLTVTNCIFTNNTAVGRGGGIANYFYYFGEVFITDSTFTGNKAIDPSNVGGVETGGGIWSEGTLTLINSSVIENEAGSYGGGVANFGTLSIGNSLIARNTASVGGGGIVHGGEVLTINNSTISNNYSDLLGGGIHSNDPMTIINSTLTENEARDVGGGIAAYFWSGTIDFKNTILARNTAASGPDCYNDVPLNSLGHNLIGDNSGCSITSAPGDQIGTVSSPIDPRLDILADNGGPTETHALLADSSAIDAGSSDCPPPTTDQRGIPRPQGSACDIGAFELVLVDTDGDGIPDIYDACPEEDATGLDADGDGCIDTFGGLTDIIDTLVDSGVIDEQMRNSLTSKVQNASNAATRENICAAVNQLEAFKNQIEAQRSKKISDEAANQFIAYADNLIAQLLDQLPPGDSC